MRKTTRYMVYAALLAAMYVALTHFQNILVPNSTSWAIQFRVSEALCVLSFFTPAAIPGLSLGCFLFNLTYGAALPLDPLVGTLATALACSGMYLTRHVKIMGLPLIGLLLPGVFNGLLVGWELTVYIGGGFWLNCLYVALGELGVLLTLGALLYGIIRKKGLHTRLFPEAGR